jgi:MFS family permease
VVERLPALAENGALIGAIATGIYLAGAATQLTMGRLVERYAMGPLFMLTGLMQAVGLVGVAVLPGWLGLVFAVFALAATFGQVIVNDMIIARSVPDAWRARAYSVRYVLGFATATLAVPIVVALHSPDAGLTPVYIALAWLGCVIGASSVLYAFADAPHRDGAAAGGIAGYTTVRWRSMQVRRTSSIGRLHQSSKRSRSSQKPSKPSASTSAADAAQLDDAVAPSCHGRGAGRGSARASRRHGRRAFA